MQHKCQNSGSFAINDSTACNSNVRRTMATVPAELSKETLDFIKHQAYKVRVGSIRSTTEAKAGVCEGRTDSQVSKLTIVHRTSHFSLVRRRHRSYFVL